MIDESKHEHLLPSLGLLTIGMGGVAFCAKVIYDTAQMSAGDGSGMQWVVLTPLTLFFLAIVYPALLFGYRGLRRSFERR